MPRIAGVNIPENKPVETALTYIYGIGRPTARRIVDRAGVDPITRAGRLSQEEVARIRDIVEKEYPVEGELRRRVMLHVKRLRDIGSYRGTRHAKGLPVRGQRTRTNSRTRRGNVRKTVGSGRRKAAEKT
ncbi:30S ribosomal protein S13 [Candidatus Azambacteria bacterium]|nr:30S ribosomal protein S13 [Candidatus Azambacteria bacterium]